MSATDLARECLYRFLAAALTDPAGTCWSLVRDPGCGRIAAAAADLLREEAGGEPIALGFGELPPDDLDLGPVLDGLALSGAAITSEYDRVFGLVPARECLPYETEYYANAEPFFGAQQLADVAGFYRAFGLEPSRVSPERPDHLALEMEFLAFLLMKKRLAPGAPGQDEDDGRAKVCEAAEATFFSEHLAWWVPSFATGLQRKAGRGFYAALARVLAALMPIERRRFGVPPPRMPLRAPVQPQEAAACEGCSS
jgi:TorA maturation chaperone TorD